MAKEIEISSLDLRYKDYRIGGSVLDPALLASIAEIGITEPLDVIEANSIPILLNGFKRRRCAEKLGINMAPVVSLGEDEVSGIMAFLSLTNKKRLCTLEEACFVHDLATLHGFNLAELATKLGRSKPWVCMRMNLFAEMPPAVKANLFKGRFPVYAYLHIVRPFMRKNAVKAEDVSTFVEALSGKKLSVREVEQLTHSYFRGPPSLRSEIEQGHVDVALEKVRSIPRDPEGCDDFERIFLEDLKRVVQYQQRVAGKLHSPRLKSRAFFAEAHLMTATVLTNTPGFLEAVRSFHDRCGDAQGDPPDASEGDERA